MQVIAADYKRFVSVHLTMLYSFIRTPRALGSRTVSGEVGIYYIYGYKHAPMMLNVYRYIDLDLLLPL